MTKTKELEQRDNYIIEEYLSGKDTREIARTYQLTNRRVLQILKDQGVELRPRNVERKFNMTPVSGAHEAIGRMLIEHRYDRDLTQHDVANRLAWPVSKLRKVEQGVAELELLDLQDIAAYLGKPFTEVINLV